jgi:hypothetical protein
MAPVTVKYSALGGAAQHQYLEGLPLGSRGGIRVVHNFPLDGEYELRVSAGTGFRFAGPDGGPPPTVLVTLDGRQINTPDARKFRVRVKAGPQIVAVALADRLKSAGIDDLYAKAQPRRDDFESLTIIGPFSPSGAGDTPSRRIIFQCHPQGAPAEESSCARQILTRLATHAFRRPVETSDPAVDTLMHFYDVSRRTGDFEDGIRAALGRLLADPLFLYRIETSSPPSAPQAEPITDIDLASRLSFFLSRRPTPGQLSGWNRACASANFDESPIPDSRGARACRH